MPSLNLPHQNRFCIGTEPAFSFCIKISTVSEVRCDCQGLGLVARIEAPILVFDTKQVLYWPVFDEIQFCSFDGRCKTCLDTKPVLYQGRFCSLTVGMSNNIQLKHREWLFFCALTSMVVCITHWSRVTHICVSKQSIIGSYNGLSPGRRQAIIWSNAGILLIGPLGTNFSEILIGIQTFSFKKMHLKMSSAKRRLFRLGLNVINYFWKWDMEMQLHLRVNTGCGDPSTTNSLISYSRKRGSLNHNCDCQVITSINDDKLSVHSIFEIYTGI